MSKEQNLDRQQDLWARLLSVSKNIHSIANSPKARETVNVILAATTHLADQVKVFLKSPKGNEFIRSLNTAVRVFEDPRSYYFFIQWCAEERLQELGLDKSIWKELTPKLGFWNLEFVSTERANETLLPRTKNPDGWTALEAARLAAAASVAIKIEDKQLALAIGEFIGETLGPKSREAIQNSLSSIMSSIAKKSRPNARKPRSHLKQLVLQIIADNPRITAQQIIAEFKMSPLGPHVQKALAKLSYLNIEIQQVCDSEEKLQGKIFYCVNGQDQKPIKFKTVLRWKIDFKKSKGSKASNGNQKVRIF